MVDDAPAEADVDETGTSPTTDEVDTAEDPPEDEVDDETSELPLPFALPPDLLVEKEYISASVILASENHYNHHHHQPTTNTADGPSSIPLHTDATTTEIYSLRTQVFFLDSVYVNRSRARSCARFGFAC
uniref:Uncharacterized protein n=1 Tax=Anopheles maculatus TaxID=74869 RepID=A0A182SUJ3_9DIPT